MMMKSRYSYEIQLGLCWGISYLKMKVRQDLFKCIYISAFLVFTGLLSTQAHADGIESTNSYVEIKSSATDFRARKQSMDG